MKKLNILFAASEVVPFAKSGGLADVAGALPKALKNLGHKVKIVMPRYYLVDKKKYNLKKRDEILCIHMGSMGELCAAIYEGVLPDTDIPVYFIEHDGFFGRKGLYDDDGYAYMDNDNRFIFLSKAVMEISKLLDFKPDIIHSNDWHTASTATLLNSTYVFDSHFENTASVLTIHNLQHQGRFYKGALDVLSIGWEHFNFQELDDFGGINLLKGGIFHTDALTTVSRKYAQEIKTQEFGWGMEGVIQTHSAKLFGILNGVDYEEWSPAVDKLIPENYDIDNMDGKKVCKRELQKTFNLPQRDDVPLIGLVGRLAEQKGISLLSQAIHQILQHDVQIILLGTGEKWAEGFFSDISAQYGDKFACYIGYRNDLAHQIEAGSDFFLMPSLFEPCGLNQIYSLRYGTLPIVRATGGLEDTIENYDSYHKSGTGFKFYDATPQALSGTINWVIETYYNDKDGMNALIKNAMEKRFDWEKAANEYLDIYQYAITKRRCRRYQ
jgi:starch synthase